MFNFLKNCDESVCELCINYVDKDLNKKTLLVSSVFQITVKDFKY